MSFHIIWIS